FLSHTSGPGLKPEFTMWFWSPADWRHSRTQSSPNMNRRTFCKSMAAIGLSTSIANRPTVARAAASLPTAGTLRPVFEDIICRWTPENPRHDHQVLFPLDDHRLMLAWSEYYADRPSLLTRKPTTQSGQAADDVHCRISARITTDLCRTWSDR